MINYYKSLLPIFLLIFMPGCMQLCQKPITKNAVAKPILIARAHDSKQETCAKDSLPPITIWIHGSRLLPKSLFKNFFYSKPGLNHYTQLESIFYQRKIAETIIASNPNKFPAQTFYLFGWSGALSSQERELAAGQLYKDLKVIREHYKALYGCEPVIQIMSHSHGGNIALLLQKVKDQDYSNFFIQQLILLACPIQMQTMKYACCPLFGKIYSLYSMLDIFQIADPQGLRRQDPQTPFFSKRLFLPDEKIEQVAVKINQRSIMHMEFIALKFLSQLSMIIDEIDSWHAKSPFTVNQWMQQNKCISLITKTPKHVRPVRENRKH